MPCRSWATSSGVAYELDVHTMSFLPHFGVATEAIRSGLVLESPELLSERTVRSISSGQPVKERTWDEYATDMVDALLNSAMFPFEANDRNRLIASFHSYRRSYEKLNDSVSRLRTSMQTVQRAVLRLQFLDLAVRYTALRIGAGLPIPEGLPLWTQEKGNNEFWKQAMAHRFPSLPMLDSKDTGGDCASRLGLSSGQMRHCLYDNAFPGRDALQRAFPEPKAYTAALRHYAASKLCSTLCQSFGRAEVECWVRKLIALAAWLHRFLKLGLPCMPDTLRAKLLKSMMVRGIEALQGKLAGEAPFQFRADLEALTRGDADGAIEHYVEFCNHFGDVCPAACWEEAFDAWQEEFDAFQRTGAFPTATLLTAKGQLMMLFANASKRHDAAAKERVLSRIVELFPLDPEAHQLLAQLCEKSGREAEAVAEFELAAGITPDFVLPLFSLADLHSRRGRHDEALRTAARIPVDGLGPGSSAYMNALCLLRASRFKEAIHPLQESHGKGWEPGVSAAFLTLACQQLATDNPALESEARKWEKIARHLGFSVEDVLKLLDVG